MTAHVAQRVSAEELLRMPDDGMRRELIAGEVRVMAPAGFEHGRVASTANRLLSVHVHEAGLGVTLGAETGFVLAHDPDTVRAPDAAFVTAARAEAVGRTYKYWPGAPDFAVEVVSPDDSGREVAEKARAWLAAGVRAVLVLDSPSRSATVHRPGVDAQTYAEGEQLDLGDAVPGWRVAVADLFD